MFGKTSSPVNDFLKKFQQSSWPKLDVQKGYKTLNLQSKYLTNLKDISVKCLEDCLNKKLLPRDDYKKVIHSPYS